MRRREKVRTQPQPQPSPPKKPRETTRATSWQRIYSNSTEVRMSGWDFAFIFGQAERTTLERSIVTELVEVIMSPTHARAIARILGAHLRLYEQKHGPIPEIDIGVIGAEEALAKAEQP